MKRPRPRMGDCPQYLPEYKLLRKIANKVGMKFDTFPKKAYRDDMGRWGLRYSQFILMAKKEVCKGGIISCHEEAILEARKFRIGIVIYVKSIQKYIWFDPEIVDRNSEKNYRGKMSFLNFNISLGRPLDW